MPQKSQSPSSHRQSSSRQSQLRSLQNLKSSGAYYKIMAAAIGFIGLGAVFYHFVERLSWLNSFYFTVVTLSTVGYGDITPHINAGKIFTIFYIFVGISIFVALARLVLTDLGARRINRAHRK